MASAGWFRLVHKKPISGMQIVSYRTASFVECTAFSIQFWKHSFFQWFAFCLSSFPSNSRVRRALQKDLFLSTVSIKLCDLILFFCLVFLHRRNKTHTLLKIASSTWFCSSALFNCGKFQLQWTSLRGLSSPSTLLFSLGEGDVFLDYGWKVDPSGFSCVLLLMSVLQMQSSHLYLEGYHMGRAWQLYIAVHMDQLSVLLIIHLRSNFLLPSSLAACWRALNSIVLQILMSSWVSGPWGWEAEF